MESDGCSNQSEKNLLDDKIQPRQPFHFLSFWDGFLSTAEGTDRMKPDKKKKKKKKKRPREEEKYVNF